MRGIFIAIEGIDVDSELTKARWNLARRIEKKYNAPYKTCHEVTEYWSDGEDDFNNLLGREEFKPIERLAIEIANHAIKYREDIQPKLNQGEHVVATNFIASTYASQYKNWETITNLQKIICNKIILPTLTFILNIEAQAKYKHQTHNEMRKKKIGYLKYARQHMSTHIINANQPTEKINLDIWKHVNARLEYRTSLFNKE